MTSTTLATGPLTSGVRVSLELPEAGTCVAVVTRIDGQAVELGLLDDVPLGQLDPGSTLDLFLPRPEGIYHWVCTVSSGHRSDHARVHVSAPPLFIQRRMGPRVGAGLEARVRRERSARRGRSYRAHVADLSRGGLKLETACHLQTGDTVEVTMDLSGGTVEVVGRVVMAYPSPDQDSLRLAHVSFLEGQAEVSENIIRFVTGQLRGATTER